MDECTTISRSEKSFLFTEDEICVAEILLDLPNIIRENESCLKFKWGSKKRRSAMDEGASSSRALSPSIDEMKTKAKTAQEEEEAAAGSPVTPLSYAPSESDEKKSAFYRSSRKRSRREEYLDSIEELTQRRELLREHKQEIGNVTKHYNKLNAYNSELKTMMKQEEIINSCPRKKETEMELSLETKIVAPHHHQQLVAHSLGPITAQFYSSYNGLGLVHGLGPFRIPDLNISAGEAFGFDPSQPLDANRAFADRRARFAEARRMRKGIIKIKAMRRACGIKLPGTKQ